MKRMLKIPGRIDDVKQLGNVREKATGWTNPQAGRVYDARGYCPTLNTMQGGCRQPIVVIAEECME